MKISRAAAIALLEDLNFKGAKNYDNVRLATRLSGIKDVLDEETKASGDNQKTLDAVVRAIDTKTDIEIEDDGTGPAKKGGKGKKAGKGKEKEKKPKKEAPAVDKFGSRVGSSNAAMNAVLTKKAKTMKELMEESKVDDTRYNHMNELIKKGFVVKTEDGYKLK